MRSTRYVIHLYSGSPPLIILYYYSGSENAMARLSKGLAKAHEAYNAEGYVSMSLDIHSPSHFILDRIFFN